MALPVWLKKRAPKKEILEEMQRLFRSLSLHTVCEEARCPNMGECFARHTAAFMILGNRCTRNCSFCAVKKGDPLPLDPEEPKNVARAVKKLGLRYVVITSVTRDDVQDGGAGQFADTIREIKRLSSEETKIEVLIPDFKGSLSSLKVVAEAKPDVLNHNLETVSRLYPVVRPLANYERSLRLLKQARELNRSIHTKSGLMVGLGEDFEEVIEAMRDLRGTDCEILTIGQYLSPSSEHLEVKEYLRPERFREYERIGRSLGFLSVVSGPFVRSSYQAREVWDKLGQGKEEM